MARNAARFGQRVAIFSLEMSAEQIVQRIVSAETGIDTQRLRLGNLKEDEWPLFVQATGKLADLPIFIDDTPSISALQLRTKARRLHAEHGLDLILVDYLQLMTGDVRSENRVQEVSYISRSLKAIARELDLPVVAASQLSRAVEQRTDKHPILADLRESGCLTGDTLVQLASGQRLPIEQLAQQGKPVEVMALNEVTWKLEPIKAHKAWATGTKPVFRLYTKSGREVRATANHKFRTLEGWKRLDELEIGEHIALPGKGHTASWDPVASISPHSVEPVYDMEVPGHHNFVAGDIVVHNSLEQDADVVMFIYRDELYHPETDQQNIADIMVAKHRNGPTGVVQLFFRKRLAQFLDAETRQQPVNLG
jgi:replicative DNA helicase